MRFLRVGQKMLGVLAVGLGVTACGSVATTAKQTPASTYLATSPTIVALLQFTHHGASATGTIRFVELDGANTSVLQQLSGTYRRGLVQLRTSDKKSHNSLVLLGTLASYGVEGTLRFGSSTTGLHLRFTRSTFVAYNRAANALRVRVLATARTRVAKQRIPSDIAVLNGELSTLTRDGSALSTDVQSLEENLSTEVTDVASAKSDTQRTEALADSTPPPTHVALCSSVGLVRTDATNVANDDQFIAGFIAGLVSMQQGVVREESKIRVDDASMRQALETKTGTAVNVPPEPTVAGVLSAATSDEAHATSATNVIVSNLNSDTQMVYSSLNSIITSTGCGPAVADPIPVSVPR